MDQDYVKTLFTYDQISGICTRLPKDRKFFKTEASWKSWNTQWAGKVIDGVDSSESSGYIRFSVGTKSYQLHRLIFLYMTGRFPENLDHIDGVKTNNSWCNLREVNHVENMRNLPIYKNNKSGHAGIGFVKASGKWRARVKVDGKEVSLGHFDNIEDAIKARRSACSKYGYHENHGRVV